MIDDEVLEDLLREVAEAITVPPDGPERILAARSIDRPRLALPHLPSGLPRLPRPRLVLGGVGVLAALALSVGLTVGLSGGGSSSPKIVSQGIASGIAASGGDGVQGSPALAVPASGHATVPPVPTQTAPSSVSPLPSKVIKTGSVTLQVKGGQVNGTVNRLTGLAAFYNGFVASTNTSSATGGPATGDITLRVPSASFESLLNQVRGLGTPTSVTTSGQDVTSQYVDLNARLQSLQDSRTQFLQILAKAQSIGDILAVEQQISSLQTQIEQLQGQLEVMNDQTSYGTLTVHVTEQVKQAAAAPGPPSGISKAWSHARHSFAHGFESVIGWLGGIALFLTCVLALALLGWLGWGVLRRRLV